MLAVVRSTVLWLLVLFAPCSRGRPGGSAWSCCWGASPSGNHGKVRRALLRAALLLHHDRWIGRNNNLQGLHRLRPCEAVQRRSGQMQSQAHPALGTAA